MFHIIKFFYNSSQWLCLRKWLPTPVFLPGEFHPLRSLAGYSPRGEKESDTTEQLTHILLNFLLKFYLLDLLSVQGTLTSLLQHHSSKPSILQHSAFFRVQLSHPSMTTGKTIALTRWTSVGKVMSLLFNMLSRLVTTKGWNQVVRRPAFLWESLWKNLCPCLF